MQMGSDRFLTGILIGIGVLILAALALFFVRVQQPSYGDESTPEGVLRNYMLSLQQQDYTRAYSYLAEGPGKPTQPQFQSSFIHYQGAEISNISVQIGDATIQPDESALVEIVLVRGSGDPFRSLFRETTTATLMREEGVWKIASAPYPFWYFDWPSIEKPLPEFTPAPATP